MNTNAVVRPEVALAAARPVSVLRRAAMDAPMPALAQPSTPSAVRPRSMAAEAATQSALTTPSALSFRFPPEFGRLGDTILERGDSGAPVRLLQRGLRYLGFDLGVDGAFGPRTEGALVSFQEHYRRVTGSSIAPDAVLGPATGGAMRAAMRSAPESEWLARHPVPDFRNPTSVRLGEFPAELQPEYARLVGLREGDDGARVIALQRQLTELGYALPVDGDFGGMTEAAVRDFQRLYATLTDHPIGAADGIVGGRTARALQYASSERLFSALPEVAREGRVVRGYENGRPLWIVTRGFGYGSRRLETRAALAFMTLSDRAERMDIDFRVTSAFRTHQRQRELYDYYVRRLGQVGRAARPGYSKHQSGIAVDFRARSTSGAAWLARRAGEYGWTLPGYTYRDGNGNVAVEDWHWEFRERALPEAVVDYWRLRPTETQGALG